MKNNNLLSICIPTYNRQKELINQLKFISNECRKVSEAINIEVIIRDNDSNNFPINEICDLGKKLNLRIYRNQTNIGAVNNILTLLNDSNSKYVWFVGDDDILHEGILEAVIKALQSDPNFVMINHKAIDKNGKILMESAFPKKEINNIFNVFRFSGTSIMFITACIYRKELINEITDSETNPNRPTLPLLWSLKSSDKGKCVYISTIFIDNLWGTTSWADQSDHIFNKLVPIEIFKSLKSNHRKIEIILSIIRYINPRKKILLRSLIITIQQSFKKKFKLDV